MTYRYVDRTWQRILQWTTLVATTLIGWAIVLLPADDPRRSQIETLVLQGDIFGYTLMAASMVALGYELWMFYRHSERWVGVVAWMHTICSGALAGYSVAALSGVIIEHSTNFGGPVLGVLLAIYHAAYVKRHPRPYNVGKGEDQSINDIVRKVVDDAAHHHTPPRGIPKGETA